MNIFTQPNNWAERKLRDLVAAKQSPDKPYVFLTSCVASTAELIDAMTEGAEELTHAELAEHCDLSSFAHEMGYCDDGLKLENDYHVSYWKSTYDGKRCYYLDHSRIEYIWIKREES